MKFNTRKIEKEKLQRFMMNTTLCTLMAANIMGIQAKPFLDTTNLDTLKMDTFGKFGADVAMANTTATTSQISVYVNGTQISFTDASPFIENGRTMVPLRGVFETMGYEVEWDADVWNKDATGLQNSYGTTNPPLIDIKSGTNILEAGTISILKDNTITQNGSVVESDAAPKMVSGRYYLPLRAIAEATGAEVNWNNDERRVDINFSGVSPTVDQTVADSNQGANYEGRFGDYEESDYRTLIDTYGGTECANAQNWNHKVFYAGAPAGNAHGLPEGAYYIDTDNAVSQGEKYSTTIGGITLANGQTVYIGESRASAEAKVGASEGSYDDGSGYTWHKYLESFGVQLSYTNSGRVKGILLTNGAASNYMNKGRSVGTGAAVLGEVYDAKTYAFGPGEASNSGSVRYGGILFSPDVNIRYDITVGSTSGTFNGFGLVAENFHNIGADPF